MLMRYFSKAAEPSIHNFFTYGVLKRSELEHGFLKDPKNGYSKFLQNGETLSKYPLILYTNKKIPCLIRKSGVGFNVKGEIFEIDDAMLKSLDRLRDNPNYYVRHAELIKVINGNSPEAVNLVRCWTYFFKLQNTEAFNSELLESYTSKVPHGKKSNN